MIFISLWSGFLLYSFFYQANIFYSRLNIFRPFLRELFLSTTKVRAWYSILNNSFDPLSVLSS